MRLLKIASLLFAGLMATIAQAEDSKDSSGFVKLTDFIPGIQTDVRYYSNDNFMGRRIKGYLAPNVYMTREAATALKAVQADLAHLGLSLLVFDAYRPQTAVNHFIAWAKDLDDTAGKAKYYPDTAKNRLFKDGYIASRSGHTRGSTADLTIAMKNSDGSFSQLDMGTGWDLLGEKSHVDYMNITGQQRANRSLLRAVMTKHGFKPYDKEWWHFTLGSEPYPETYFDFPVK